MAKGCFRGPQKAETEEFSFLTEARLLDQGVPNVL